MGTGRAGAYNFGDQPIIDLSRRPIIGAWVSRYLFFAPPSCLLTVAHALALAVLAETPRRS